jgi:WD40 repeat protein
LLFVSFTLIVVSSATADDERTVWKYDKGVFEKTGEGKWIEKAPDGTHKLEEKERTDKYIELVDKTRKLTIRLTDTTVLVKNGDKGQFKVTHKGGWGDAVTTTPDPKTPDPKSTPDSGTKSGGLFSEVAQIKRSDTIPRYDFALSPDGKLVAMMIGSPKEHEFAILDTETGKTVQSWKINPIIESVAWSADGSALAGVLLSDGDQKAQIYIFDTKTWTQRASFELPKAAHSVAISANGGVVAAATGAIGTPGWLKAWDVTAKKEIFTFEVSIHFTPQVALSADGTIVSTNGPGQKTDHIGVFELPSGKPLGVLPIRDSYIMSSDGKTYVDWQQVAEGKNVNLHINVWNVDTAAKGPRVIKPGKLLAERAVFLDKDRAFAIGGGLTRDEVRVYDVKTLALVSKFNVGEASKVRHVLNVKSAPDSAQLATMGTDHIVRLWSTPFGDKPKEKEKEKDKEP